MPSNLTFILFSTPNLDKIRLSKYVEIVQPLSTAWIGLRLIHLCPVYRAQHAVPDKAELSLL